MAPFRLAVIARRHHAATMPRPARRALRLAAPSAAQDVHSGQLFRGLMYGVPIGLAMWLFLALLLWQLA